MAIDTTNKKLAIMEFGQIWEPGLPISPGVLGQDDKQQLLHGYPGILWAGGATSVNERKYIGMINNFGRLLTRK